jgi:ribonuclease J
MPVEICTVGGFSEVGKNCTAIKIDDEVVIMDLGLHMEKWVAFTESDDILDFSHTNLTRIGAVPDLKFIKDWLPQVKAVIPTHAHLDHIGAIPWIANKIDADILTTPYAKALIEAICADEKIQLKNKVKSLNTNSVYQLSDNIKVEFIHMTHSTPHTALVALHTKYGIIMYANDFKFDNKPVLGKKPNYARMKELGKKGVLCLIADSLYSKDARKTPSESVARDMLKDVLLSTDSKGKAVIVTTFSSHLARLKTIIECGQKMNRKILFLGRSLGKYVIAGEKVGLINFTKDVKLVRFKKQMAKVLKQIQKQKHKYLIVCTGHQGEPRAVLSRIIDKSLNFKIEKGDQVVFSCNVIPTSMNKANREAMEEVLKAKGARIFTEIHVSGHASREDHRDLLDMIKPKHVIPSHCDIKMAAPMAELAKEMGWSPKCVHLMSDGERVKVK